MQTYYTSEAVCKFIFFSFIVFRKDSDKIIMNLPESIWFHRKRVQKNLETAIPELYVCITVSHDKLSLSFKSFKLI